MINAQQLRANTVWRRPTGAALTGTLMVVFHANTVWRRPTGAALTGALMVVFQAVLVYSAHFFMAKI